MGDSNSKNTKNEIAANNPKANQQPNSPLQQKKVNQEKGNNKDNDKQNALLIQSQNIIIDNNVKGDNSNKQNESVIKGDQNINKETHKEGVEKYAKTVESLNQTQNESLISNHYGCFNHEGECITLCFGDSFDAFDSFFTTISNEHSLDATPRYNYSKFFIEESMNLKARGIAIDIPENQFKILNESPIQSRYQQSNFKVKPYNSNESFASAYYDTNQVNELNEILRKEAEKCTSVSQLHFLGNSFSGYSMGLCSTLLYEISNDFRTSFKIVHLKYADTFTNKAFSKIKNYIYGISTIYDNAQMINMFNTPLFGDVISSLTIGDRISQYSAFNLNRIASTLLIDPKTNFIYSNGIELKQDRLADCAKFLYEDCKEGKSHLYLTPQFSSLTIYKGMQLGDELKLFFKERLNQLKNKKLKMRNSYFALYEAKEEFKKEFAANFHLSNYFKEYTDEFALSFIQNYNLEHFTQNEMDLRQSVIERVNDLINNYKEIWKLVK